MKAIKRKIAITVLAVTVTFSIAFAGLRNEPGQCFGEPCCALRGVAACYQFCPQQ